MTLAEGLNVLHLDAGDNDSLVQSLLDAAPSYIETATGLSVDQQDNEPLCKTATGFILRLWYFADHADDVALTRTLESLLKSIKAKVAATSATIDKGVEGNIPVYDSEGKLVDSGVRFATDAEVSAMLNDVFSGGDKP